MCARFDGLEQTQHLRAGVQTIAGDDFFKNVFVLHGDVVLLHVFFEHLAVALQGHLQRLGRIIRTAFAQIYRVSHCLCTSCFYPFSIICV